MFVVLCVVRLRHIAACRRGWSTTFVAYGPLALGLLTGKPDFGDTSWGRGKTLEQLSAYQRSLFGPDVIGRHLAYVERLRGLSTDASLSLAQMALASVATRDEFTIAIAGSTSPVNTTTNAAAGD